MESSIPGVCDKDWEFILRQLKRLLSDETIVYFYGSRQRGSNKLYSDLDISLHEKVSLSPSKLRALNEIFSDSNLPYKVDLSDFQSLDEKFQSHILGNSTSITLKTVD